jgi:hypothetical protein
MAERLVVLHQDGLCFSTIARILAEEFQLGVTKNQAIGKARRLGLRCPDKPPKSPAPRKRSRNSNGRLGSLPLPAPPPLPPLLPASTLPREAWRIENLPVLALNPGECHFPSGGPPYQFCGRPQVEGFDYCAGHLAVMFRPRRW